MIKCGICKNHHASIADVRACSQVKYSGQPVTTATITKPAEVTMPQATAPQIKYIIDLAAGRDTSKLLFTYPTLQLVNDNDEALRNGDTLPHIIGRLAASALIDELLDCPKLPDKNHAVWIKQVPEGRYAVEIAGKLRFFRVKHTKNHKVHIAEQASDAHFEKKFIEYKTIIDAILAFGVQEAGRLYGRELKTCWKCGRSLTHEISRAMGEGPICGGWG